jgi:hypothetical protein
LICRALQYLGQPAEDSRLAADYCCWLLVVEVLAERFGCRAWAASVYGTVMMPVKFTSAARLKRKLVLRWTPYNKSLQVSRDCVSLIKSLFSQVVATRAAT